jgi:hypothetical protein
VGSGKINNNSNFIEVRRDGIMFIGGNKCPICGYKSLEEVPLDSDSHYNYCAVCGPIAVVGKLQIPRHRLAPYLFYHREEKLSASAAFFFIGHQVEFEKIKDKYSGVELLTNRKVNTWYEQVRNKKAEEILRALSTYDSDKDGYIELKCEEINSAFFLEIYNSVDVTIPIPIAISSYKKYVIETDRNEQINYVFRQLNKFIEQHGENPNKIKILPEGREKIEELKKGA